jgi:2',3'-cyclic-nucleotide 2'-phosphodiesterase (5'-nucleotidase family)
MALGQTAAAARTTPEIRATASETAVDASLPDDAAVDRMLAVYAPRVRVLDTVIGELKGDLTKPGIGSGSLGNFVSDAMRIQASRKLGKPFVLAVTNGGGLRKSVITAGKLRLRDVFELMPFENALMSFDLTGAQILRLLGVVVAYRDAQSGARIKYRTEVNQKPELESARLLIDGAEHEIDPAATYTIISIDYLFKRLATTPSATEGDYSVLREAKNITPLGLTIRDAIADYVRAETAAGREIKPPLDGRFVFDRAASPGAEEPKP